MIIWRDTMNVGAATVDNDRRELIAIINEFENGGDPDLAEATAKKLYALTQEGFRREEKLQEESRFPGSNRHRNEHALIRDKLEALIRGGFAGQDRGRAERVAQLRDLMRDWVIGHVLRSDMEMKPHIAFATASPSPRPRTRRATGRPATINSRAG